MALFRAWQLYSTCTEEQKNILRKKRFSGTMSISEWITVLQRVSDIDEHINSSVLFLVLTMCISPLLALFLGAYVHNSLFVPFTVLMLLAFVVHHFVSKVDIHDNLTRFIIPLLYRLQSDVKPHTELTMHLDVRGSAIKEKCTESRGDTERLERESTYIDHWNSGEVELHNQLILKWNIEDTVYESLEMTDGEPTYAYENNRMYTLRLCSNTALTPSAPTSLDSAIELDVECTNHSTQITVKKEEQTLDRVEVIAHIEEFTELLDIAYTTARM